MTNITLQQIDNLLKKRLKNFATKGDLKRELGKYATKDDVIKLRKDIKEDIDQAFTDVFQAADKNKAEKADLISLQGRVKRIENHLDIVS